MNANILTIMRTKDSKYDGMIYRHSVKVINNLNCCYYALVTCKSIKIKKLKKQKN